MGQGARGRRGQREQKKRLGLSGTMAAHAGYMLGYCHPVPQYRLFHGLDYILIIQAHHGHLTMLYVHVDYDVGGAEAVPATAYGQAAKP